MKTRLSKLQKLILEEGNQYKYMNQNWIIHKYFKNRTSAAEVSVSRCIWKLIENGYLQGSSPMKLEQVMVLYGMWGKTVEDFNRDYEEVLKEKKKDQIVPMPALKGITKAKLFELTELGKQKVKELLNVK